MASLGLFLLFTVAGSAWASPDYEAQLGHSLERWSSALELVQSEGASSVGVTYLCKVRSSAEALAKELNPVEANIQAGELLGYSFSVHAPVNLNGSENLRQWVRRQFFIGVAYECDMDGLFRIP